MLIALGAVLLVALAGSWLAPRVRFALRRTAHSEDELKQFAKLCGVGQSFLFDDALEYGQALSDRDIVGEFNFARIDDSTMSAYRWE